MLEFDLAFKQFITNRTDAIGRTSLKELGKYNELNSYCIKLFKDIYNQLPDDSKMLLYEYECKSNILQGLAETIMYEQGLKDGVSLSRILSGG
ncbi:hypothetical protein [Paenibacillus elgii]|uniref:hypothetical protein n=1 Tax=Paenibacillus elgii TaxID=189691 RepID=UPI0013D74AC9|nr:hypothetical protein [Paenibacillus elgii]